MSHRWATVRTVNGHLASEVSSALQKSIRLCRVKDAVIWALELYKSGYHAYAWKRMSIMVSEDIGMAEPNLPANFEALYQQWARLHKESQGQRDTSNIKFVHAVVLLASSRKNRMIDHVLCWHLENDDAIGLEIPDCAIDKHTDRGRKAGRGILHFVEVGQKVENFDDLFDVSLKEEAEEYQVLFDKLCREKWSKPGEKADCPISPDTKPPAQKDLFGEA